VATATGVPMGSVGGATGSIDQRLRLQKCPSSVLVDQPLYDAIAIRCPSLGWRIRVPLVAKTRPVSATESPSISLVHRGDVVELVYDGPGFAATTSAVALDEASEGKAIRVRTAVSATPISATVSRAGEVRISH
jgi:flagellar basal body P-ring formation protein FlgA